MKKIILAAFMAACGLQMSAQQNLFVAQDLESAIVNKDNTVTFNFKAPDAQKVQIAGDFAEKAEGQHIGGMVGALRGIGYSVMPMIVSILGVCVLRLVWLATVFQIPEYHRIETVYLSYPVTWILTSLVYIVLFIWVRVRTCRKSAAA